MPLLIFAAVHTIDIIGRGFITGLGLSLGLGAVFFALIQNSIKSGYKTGISIASGVILCDIIFITFALLGTSFFSESDLKNTWIQLLAISFLIFLGIYTLFHSKQPVDKTPGHLPITVGSVVYFFIKGFLLNALNPANFFAWAAVSTYTSGTLGYSINQNILFFSFSLVAIFFMECLLSFGAHKIKNKLTDKFILWMNRSIAILYITIAIALIVNLFL